jgi:hypothetical protein
MIDRKRVREIAQDKTPRWFAKIGGETGVNRPWRLSWFVLMGLVKSETAEAFDELRPRFGKAHKTFSVWMAKLKQDPRQHEAESTSAHYFRDESFALAFKILMEEADRVGMSCYPDNPRYEVIHAIWSLRDKLSHWPK